MNGRVVVIVLIVLVVFAIAIVTAGVVAWRLIGRRLSRQARLLLAEERAASGPHQAVVGWRRALGDEVEQTRRTLDSARRAGAAIADIDDLLHSLERAVAELDLELAVLAMESDPAVVDRVLRSDVGLRAERVLSVAGQLRRAVGKSLASGNSDTVDDLAASAELSTKALSAALEELNRRQR